MNIAEIKNIVEEFIKIIESDIYPVPEKDLIILLDKLALSTNYFNDIIFDEKNYPEAPHLIYEDVRKVVNNKFPDYGYYNIPNDISGKIADTEVLVGDAIDDISDIYLDLKKIAWKFQNTSYKDALYDYQFDYNTHWGEHLRNLQWYIYHLNFDKD